MIRYMATALMAWTLASCASVSTQQEVELGTDYARRINAELPIVNDPEVNRYINRLGDSIAGPADDRHLSWHFYVVNSPEVNAFAVPGGFVYINRGLIERADNLAQVAGVLGHEIGHVTQRHSIKQLEKAQTANVGMVLVCVLTPSVCQSGLGNAGIQLGGAALFSSFSRSDENDADRVAVGNVVRSGIDPRGIPAMFRKLLEERQRRGAGVEAWFSTHPLEENRIRDTEAIIAQYSPTLLRTLTLDSPQFQDFKRRVRALPAAPVRRAGR